MSNAIKKSFSLIEVLIFVTILSIVLITSASIITISMRQNSVKISLLKAVHYNEQLMEWMRSERELEWSSFTTHGDSVGISYCFSQTTFSWESPIVGDPRVGCSANLDGVFRRYATIKSVGLPVTEVQVTVHTEWESSGSWHTTELHSLFTLWE